MNEFAKLLGTTVKALAVEKATQEAIRFEHPYRDATYIGTYADCCSETWFADIVGVEHLLGQQIIGVELLELPEPDDDRTRQESDSAYGIRLKTRKGDCDIIYRNSSNGYYGGSESAMSKTKGEALEWLPITADWQA